MVWLLAGAACRGAAGLRFRLGPLVGSPLGPAAPWAPRLALQLGPSPKHAQISFVRTGSSSGGSLGGGSSSGGGGGRGRSSSSPRGSSGLQDSKKTEARPIDTAAMDTSIVDQKKPDKYQQLKKVFREYGAVAVSLHIGISLISLGIIYLIVSSGVDMSSFLIKLGFAESFHNSKIVAGTSTFVMAYAIHKLFAPVRISITLFSLPLVVRYFRKVGLFKPPGSKP